MTSESAFPSAGREVLELQRKYDQNGQKEAIEQIMLKIEALGARVAILKEVLRYCTTQPTYQHTLARQLGETPETLEATLQIWIEEIESQIASQGENLADAKRALERTDDTILPRVY